MALRSSRRSRKVEDCLQNCALSHFAIIFSLFLLIDNLAFVEGDDCRIIQFREEIKNKILTNHVIKSDRVTNQEICKINCYLEIKCVSYNYGLLEDGSLFCELNDKTHLQVPSVEFIARNGFIYSPIITSCQSSPCTFNATCQEGFGDQGYRCVCPQGYHGDQCQLDVRECLDGSNNCSSNATCVDVPGSFECKCKSGYTGDGVNCTGLCPPSWMAFNGSCYTFSTDEKDWNNAKAFCSAHGAQLVKIETADENNFIKGEFLANTADYLIGLTDEETENYWKWTDGSELTGYINWIPGQPNDYKGQDCAAIRKGRFGNKDWDGEWHDVTCSNVRRFICEMY